MKSNTNNSTNAQNSIRELNSAEIASVSGGDITCGAVGGFVGYLLGAPIVCTDSSTGVTAAYYF